MYSAKENVASLDDKKHHLHILTLQLRLLELEANRIRACGSASLISYKSTSRANTTSNFGSIVSLQSGNEAPSRSGSPLPHSSSSSAPKFLKSSKSFESNSSGDFERHANFLGKSFLLSLADAASQEVSRDLQALELETRNFKMTLQGKIEAYKSETTNLKVTKEAAKKLDDQLGFKEERQFFRWISKLWIGNTERDLRYLKLKIKSDERHQQLKLFSMKTNADVDLLVTNNTKLEHELISSVSSMQKLYEENNQLLSRKKQECNAADKIVSEVDGLQKCIAVNRKKTHEKSAMKFNLEMKNQSLVKHLMDIEEAKEFNTKRFGLKSVPDIEFVSLWMKSINLERNMRQDLQISQRRKAMLAFQVKRAKAQFARSRQKVITGPQCSPVDTVRLSTKSDQGTSTSNLTTHSSTPAV